MNRIKRMLLTLMLAGTTISLETQVETPADLPAPTEPATISFITLNPINNFSNLVSQSN